MADMVNQSWLGVMTAAKMAMNRMAGRRHFRSRWLDRTPTAVSDTRTSGNSKESPNAAMSNMTNEMYLAMDRTANKRWFPAKPSRNPSAFGSVNRANAAPMAKRTRDEMTKGQANRRSRVVSAGVTNIQNSYSTTGRARANPRNTTT